MRQVKRWGGSALCALLALTLLLPPLPARALGGNPPSGHGYRWHYEYLMPFYTPYPHVYTGGRLTIGISARELGEQRLADSDLRAARASSTGNTLAPYVLVPLYRPTGVAGDHDANPAGYRLTLDTEKANTDLDTIWEGCSAAEAQLDYYHAQRVTIRYQTKYRTYAYRQSEGPVWFIIPAKGHLYVRDFVDERTPDRLSYYTLEEQAAIKALHGEYLALFERLERLAAAFFDMKQVEIGGRHPQLGAAALEMLDDLSATSALGTPRTADEFLQLMVYDGYDAVQAAELIREVYPAMLDAIDGQRVQEPAITRFAIGSSVGRIDPETKSITLRRPVTDGSWTEDDVKMELSRFCEAELKTQSGNVLTYELTPHDGVTGSQYKGGKYDTGGAGGVSRDGEYTDLRRTWTVTIDNGEPYNDLLSFGLEDTQYGKLRYAAIVTDDNSRKGTVTLNMPNGTDLTKVPVHFDHMGTKLTYTLDGKEVTVQDGDTIDFTRVKEIKVVNGGYSDLTNTYTLNITAGPSAENRILSFRVNDIDAHIDQENHTISVELPYGTPIAAAVATWEVSEFADMTQQPARLAYDQPLTYTVTSETGVAQAYTLTITQRTASSEKEITAFSYGSAAGVIDQRTRTIQLTVPRGTNLTKLTPTVQVSMYATVSPASGAAWDFSKGPVTYWVTAQDKSTHSYTVTVTLGEAQESPNKEQLEEIREKIIDTRYHTIRSDGTDHDGKVSFDDWELMNLGFYECTEKVEPGEQLPYGLNIYDQIKQLKSNSMTDLARGIMMLTALGIDATQLDAYGDGTAFILSRGEEVSNLVEEIYSFSGGYTINGPIFALIALDMGNYNVPSDAKWTREKLLEEILAHEYGSDGFDIDMVGMLMQSLYPYLNDVKYGSRVQEKMELGLNLILGNVEAEGVTPMSGNYTFTSWGASNSEAAVQAICALCAYGIDPDTDPRFSDAATGNSVIKALLENFALTDNSGFGHADNKYNAMATYQGCYGIQWYLNFLENGGAGVPYSLYYQRFDFSRPLSKECNITSFVLEGQEGNINGSFITVQVPEGMPLTGLTPELELSPGAKLVAPTLPTNFVNGAPAAFTVLAEDGETRNTYTVTPEYTEGVVAKGCALRTDSIKIQNEDMSDKEILETRATVGEDGVTELEIIIVPGVDTSKLRFIADLSYKATASINTVGKEEVDLSDWRTVTITAEDPDYTRTYRIKVVSQEYASIEEFVIEIDGVEYGASITSTDERGNHMPRGTIRFSGVPGYADLTFVTPKKVTLGPGTTELLPAKDIPQNFAEGGEYTVKGPGLNTYTYDVVVGTTGGNDGGDGGEDDKPVNNAFAITSFKINGVKGEIDELNSVIRITLPYSTNVRQLVPEIEAGSGCTLNPVSGQVVNFSFPVNYTVTRGKESRTYSVVVILEKSPSQQLWDEGADRFDPAQNQTSPDSSAGKVPQPVPPAADILAHMRMQENTEKLAYTVTAENDALVVAPESYHPAAVYRFRAERGALGDLVKNGYAGLELRLGVFRLTAAPAMETAQGLDLTVSTAPAGVQAMWNTLDNRVSGPWSIQSTSAAGGLAFAIDCTAAPAGAELALVRYSPQAGFRAVAAKQWSVADGILTARELPAGIYGVIRLS